MAPPRIGILGGTFDPIHLGHLVPAEYACGHLGLDRLYLVPSAAPVHRPRHTPASPEHRLRMCELAAKTIPPFAVSDCEIRRSEPSYTILTIEHFAQTVGPDATLFLVLGDDNLPLLHTWHRIADLPQLARLAILPRPPASTPADEPQPHRGESAGPPSSLKSPISNLQSESTPTLHSALCTLHADAVRIPSPLLNISSTDIRRRIRDGQPIAGLVPATVADYIARHGLYRS